jgi:16S rRNA G527 N7-methylase RsmG
MIKINNKCYDFILDLNEELRLYMTFICIRINNIQVSINEVQYDPITNEYRTMCFYEGEQFIGKVTNLDGSLKKLSARIIKHHEKPESKTNS